MIAAATLSGTSFCGVLEVSAAAVPQSKVPPLTADKNNGEYLQNLLETGSNSQSGKRVDLSF